MKKAILAIILATLLIGIAQVSALTISSVSTNPAEILPGNKVGVGILIENNLNSDAEDITFTLDLTNIPFAPYQSSNQQSLDRIKEGRENEIFFDLIADSNAESGTYKIPVIISYTIDSEQKQTEGLISLIINAKPSLELTVEDSVLIKGKDNDLKIRVTNSGLGQARLLNLNLNSASGISIIGTKNVYMGNIDSDDFDTADFKIFVKQDASSLLNLQVELNYRDSRNNEISETKELSVRSYSNEEAVSLGLVSANRTGIYIGVIIAVILVYIIYRFIKKRRKRKSL